MKYLQIYFAASILTVLGGCYVHSYSGKSDKQNDEECIFFFNKSKLFWEADSLGANGFRWLAAHYLIENNFTKCKLTNKVIISYLGHPYKTNKVFYGNLNKECTELQFPILRNSSNLEINTSDQDLIITLDNEVVMGMKVRIFE